jgi:tetratricopeptide (TPR) repeat protein
MRNFAKRLFHRMCALLVIPVLLSLSSTAMAQSIPPELSELHHAWQSHFWAGRNTEALGALHEMLDRAREGSPESAWVYSEIADIYLYRLRDASQARTNYEMALGIFRNLAKNGNKRYPAECSTLFNIRMIDFARAKVIDASQFEEAIDRLVPYA